MKMIQNLIRCLENVHAISFKIYQCLTGYPLAKWIILTFRFCKDFNGISSSI